MINLIVYRQQGLRAHGVRGIALILRGGEGVELERWSGVCTGVDKQDAFSVLEIDGMLYLQLKVGQQIDVIQVLLNEKVIDLGSEGIITPRRIAPSEHQNRFDGLLHGDQRYSKSDVMVEMD